MKKNDHLILAPFSFSVEAGSKAIIPAIHIDREGNRAHGFVSRAAEGETADIRLSPCPDPETPSHTYHVNMEESHSGPTRVSSPSYCEGWQRIFGEETPQGTTLN